MSYKSDKYDNFGIHKDLDYKSCKQLKNCNLKTILDRLLSNYILDEINDPKLSYYYYLSRYMDHLDWYKDNKFKFWNASIAPQPYRELLIIQNNETGLIDNVIPFTFFNDIKDRIIKDSNAYVASRHAINRAAIRIFELRDKNQFDIENWLLKRVNKLSKPCHPINHYSVLQLLNHNFQQCTYRMDSEGRVYVIVNHKIMTVHWNESERFKKD